MSAGDKAKEIVQDLTGMWWPDGDADALREAARVWRTYADDVEECTAAAHKSAQDVIDNNKGRSIEAFSAFWRRYHGSGKGYLDDLASAARDMAKALDKFADEIDDAQRKIQHELAIAGAVVVAGTALAVFTGGITELAAAGAAEAIVAAASTASIAVSVTITEIAGTVLATAAIGCLEAITVDVVVAQGGRNLLGDQRVIDLGEMKHAGLSGLMAGGAYGGAAKGVQAVNEAGGIKTVLSGFQGVPVNTGPSLAMPEGMLPGVGGSGLDAHWVFAWKDLPQEVKDNFYRGNKFNRENYGRYPANEVHLTNGKRLDSYTPGKEIVSRKHAQLSEVEPKTARSYLDEITNKYEPDTVIRSNKYPELDGKPLSGDMILEVPVQVTPIPQEIIEHAQELNIMIRDVTGHVYT
ncbi:hypothetical protein SSP35_22_00120 [Streptomyces sp. NBRC 110611]|uniref:WXG100 family type VII secretion target n=1 Tax=Streptomyces sp. NBRC 110611 TaxID=1621259 RepID=UPI0008551444|nr:WXG100 family type VII secretion target [Streptomyces sp. NBRC 110611]GAU70709.1 hypothetical protein SSP35_22_00120 [Streptomyces sp. NBRC 110611]